MGILFFVLGFFFILSFSGNGLRKSEELMMTWTWGVWGLKFEVVERVGLEIMVSPIGLLLPKYVYFRTGKTSEKYIQN